MAIDGEQDRELATLSVPLLGRLEQTCDPWLPFRLVDGGGVVVEGVSVYFRELQAEGKPGTTIRSYGMDLLRWFRFLWAIGVAWHRASRVEAREFSRWMLLGGKPVRPHWRRRRAARRGRSPRWALLAFGSCAQRDGVARLLRLPPSSRAAVRCSTRSRWTGRGGAGRAHAHHNPMEPHRNERTGLYRPTVPSRIPRSIPDEEFNEIFARLPSHRDRALVAFYVSTGARAAELLSVNQGRCRPGSAADHGGPQGIAGGRRSCRHPRMRSSGCGSIRSRWTGVIPRAGTSRCGGRCGVRAGR